MPKIIARPKRACSSESCPGEAHAAMIASATGSIASVAAEFVTNIETSAVVAMTAKRTPLALPPA